MSAGVINPTILNEFTRLRSPASLRQPLVSAGAARVKRDLFGPVDKEDSKKFLERELAIQNDIASKKWGFDFMMGEPLKSHEKYIWERVPPTNAPPSPYIGMLTRTAHEVERPLPTETDRLVDRRAERANRAILFSDEENDSQANSSESETEVMSPVQTYPTLPEKPSTTAFPSTAFRAKRQQRITDYLKERKRLQPATSKLVGASPAKKLRTSLNSSGIVTRKSSSSSSV